MYTHVYLTKTAAGLFSSLTCSIYLRQAHAEQAAMLESSLAAKGKSAKHALRERLAALR